MKIKAMSLLLGICLAASAASAASVQSATIAGNQLTIKGTFALPIQSVRLGSSNLTLASSSTTQIVAPLSPIPTIGTYKLSVHDAAGISATSVAVSEKILEGWVNSNGTISSGAGFTVVRNTAGNYTVSWPAGTLYQCCGVLPVVLVRSTWGNSLGNIQYLYHNGNGSGTFTVDFGGVDTYFVFNMTQTY